jgi:hypothetical protein
MWGSPKRTSPAKQEHLAGLRLPCVSRQKKSGIWVT